MKLPPLESVKEEIYQNLSQLERPAKYIELLRKELLNNFNSSWYYELRGIKALAEQDLEIVKKIRSVVILNHETGKYEFSVSQELIARGLCDERSIADDFFEQARSYFGNRFKRWVQSNHSLFANSHEYVFACDDFITKGDMIVENSYQILALVDCLEEILLADEAKHKVLGDEQQKSVSAPRDLSKSKVKMIILI